MGDDEEAELLRRARTGDADAFAILFKRSERQVRARLSHFPFIEERIDELTQDVRVTAWQDIASFEERSSFSTWIVGIARNRGMDEARSKDLRDGRIQSPYPHDDSESLPEAVEPGASPEDEADDGEILARFERLEATFLARDSLAFRLKLQGLSSLEIAAFLEESADQALARLERVRKRLARNAEEPREKASSRGR